MKQEGEGMEGEGGDGRVWRGEGMEGGERGEEGRVWRGRVEEGTGGGLGGGREGRG
jgi:hypothetical protein